VTDAGKWKIETVWLEFNNAADAANIAAATAAGGGRVMKV
jgi:hypothetical protein